MKNIKKNKYIADFMECNIESQKETGEHIINRQPLTHFNYITSWDHLMPVIEKIEGLDLSDWFDDKNFINVNVSIESGRCSVFIELNFDPPHRVTGLVDYDIPKIELVHSQAIEFIAWYNEGVKALEDKN
tara:strand:+ start:420 stop:809 length:390 start_codon:yes stop_codon:yes gene_type:complete